MSGVRLSFFAFLLVWASMAQAGKVVVMTFEGVVNPVAVRYISRGISRAEKEGAECLVLAMDTPGGVDRSMRVIVQRILAAKVPVVVYVSPKGARAASAGTFITLAGHVAAMSPGTAIGAAHPVEIGKESPVAEKITNDAAAYIKTIALGRGRNAAWADSAVRWSVSITEQEALAKQVIDLVAGDVNALLDSLDGREVEAAGVKRVLHTKGSALINLAMNARESFLHAVAHPNIAYVLFLIGIYGVIYELANPGAILPGVAGGIALILAFVAFETLSINLAGLLLLLFAVLLFVVDIKAPTHGILTVGGIVALTLGSFMLFNPSTSFYRLSIWLILTMVAVTTAFFVLIVTAGVKALKRRVRSGAEGLVGRKGVAKTLVGQEGIVLVEGEDWNASAEEGEIPAGDKVEVMAVEGLKVKVRRPQSS
jgi:membrane-bound serine protease (ClpP class)